LIKGDTTILDSFPISRASLLFLDCDSSDFTLDQSATKLIWVSGKKTYPKDSVTLCYRVVQFDFNKVYRYKDPKIRERFYTDNPFSYVPPNKKFNSLREDNISTIGNIARGIGFGNNQDLVVNSNLNLKMSGKIGDNINVLAAVSDENNPIQPEGNTQQLQDFDRVYISLWNDSTSLTVGDFPMTSSGDWYFMRYKKRSRGLQFTHQLNMKNGQWTIEGDGAVSRGRFTRNLIDGIEGNQGPYRLRGSNGELFIIVIAGTEKVYLDGKLLERGQQNDYTIDYNSGEITFTPKHLITAYSRLVVEFQYSDRNYGRSVVRLGSHLKKNKWELYTNYFSEQDHKNQPFQQDLDAFDSLNNVSAQQILARAGDGENAFINSAREIDAFDPDRILYRRIDSSGFGEIFIHVESEQEVAKFYQVNFSFVGEGNGDYNPKNTNANGKVYEWIEPQGGVSRGSYAPVEILIAPERMQMLSIGTKYNIDKATFVKVELTQSIEDLNTFSSIDQSDNGGTGLFIGLEHFLKKGKDSLKKWEIGTRLDYEYTFKDFRYIERYRDVEFDRKWNRTLQNQGDIIAKLGNEHVANWHLQLSKAQEFQLAIDENYFQRSSAIDGWQQNIDLQANVKSWQLRASSNNMRTEVPFETAVSSNIFDHFNVRLTKIKGRNRFGVTLIDETSNFSNKGSDSLLSASYAFRQIQAFIGNSDSGTFKYNIEVRQRNDAQVFESVLSPKTIGKDAAITTGWHPNRDLQLDLIGSYRILEFKDTSQAQDEETVQGRLELRWKGLKRLITTQTFYQLGTGQEQKREFSYLQVGDGNGLYIWNDFDSNGIQSLDEFVVSSEYDRSRANYIRQFLPVAGLIKTYSTEFNNSIRIQAINRKKEPNQFEGLIRRFSIISSTRIQKKVNQNTPETFLNPFNLLVEDSTLISTNSIYRNVLSFNRSNPVFGMDYQYLINNGKTLLVNGFDNRQQQEQKITTRWNIANKWELTSIVSSGKRSHISEFLGERSYDYNYSSWAPRFQFYFNKNVRLGGSYSYFEASNANSRGGGKTYNHKFGSNFRWNIVNKGSLQSEIALVNVNFIGDQNSALGYALLEGLKNGRNITWNLNIEQRFSQSIQALISYDGRSSETGPMIHIGRIQIRYLF